MTEITEQQSGPDQESSVTTQITVEVAYALPDKQEIIKLVVPEGTTALEAVRLSNIVERFAEIDITRASMGIFSQILGSKGLAAPGDYLMRHRDRVEIYRPLLIDPKEIRRQRAAKSKSTKTK
jgi:uncharacterized protein